VRKFIKTLSVVWLILIALRVGIGWYLNLRLQNNTGLLDPLKGYVVNEVTSEEEPTGPVDITVVPTAAKIANLVKPTPRLVGDTRPWGVATQVDEHTWTLRVGMDKRMATANEILKALNDYRVRLGSQPLSWNDNLGNYAQERADYLNKIKSTDGHKGFSDFLENQNGYDKLGFSWLGENISYGYQLEAVHLIEWMYAGDKPHDDNQRDNKWNYVGIGVNGLATALIFGTGKR
jgi:uncharacterized protein YkwD